uniref:Uncharacterized protein n=1 Tax=viral metagenome TaxID=1070528 RepID=A0A6C0EL39_9ZZZZ
MDIDHKILKQTEILVTLSAAKVEPRDWEYKPEYLSEYWEDLGEDYGADSELKMVERADDVLSAIVGHSDINALTWFNYNWVNSITNDIFDDYLDDMIIDLKDFDDYHDTLYKFALYYNDNNASNIKYKDILVGINTDYLLHKQT